MPCLRRAGRAAVSIPVARGRAQGARDCHRGAVRSNGRHAPKAKCGLKSTSRPHLHKRLAWVGEPQHRNNRFGTRTSHRFATATFTFMLRFEKRQKPRGIGLCCGVAVENGERTRCAAVLRYVVSGARHLDTPKQKHAESNIVENRANRPFFDPPGGARVGSLSQPSMTRISDGRGSESTRLGSPPKSRIRTGLPRRHICGARRMAHGQDFPGRS
jgi:hypothetical protein